MKRKMTAEQVASKLINDDAIAASEKVIRAASVASSVLTAAKAASDRDFVLSEKMGKLQGTIEMGFLNVDRHFTILNGQVLDHAKLINKLMAKDSFQDGEKKGMSNVTKTIITLVTIAVAILALFVKAGCWAIVCNAKP